MMLERLVACCLIVLLSPLLVTLSLMIMIDSGWPFWFVQKRVGKKGKVFWFVKFRSMYIGAEHDQKRFCYLNEADGPVFKIREDPRLTRVGRLICHSGTDELLQLINVAKGEMSLVGPRPLPVSERNKLAKKYLKREEVNPGIISPWVFLGYHRLSFDKWMESDLKYVKNKNWKDDFKLLIMGVKMVVTFFVRRLLSIVFG
jgi:lipopolysaccharide/colanic/teichoic acid biosynthesis glycosyltransferase